MRRMPIPARPKGLSSPGDAPRGCTRYQPPFRRVVPLAGAGCIRVTHPCAGRRRDAQARPPLPLDLHVLSLPLAFILSQDQTLRCLCFRLATNLSNCPSRPSGVVSGPRKTSPPKGTARKPRCFLCPVASLSMSLGIPVNPGRPLRLAPFPFCECKVTTFPRNTQTFLELFPNFFVEAQSKRCQTHI